MSADEDLRRAREAITAMHAEGDPMGFVRPYREARDQDQESGGDLRRIGMVSALTLLAAGALSELDRVAGREGAGLDWLRGQALRDEQAGDE